MQQTVSLHQLEQFAQSFWSITKDSSVIAFHGQMGAGKTTIINALCKAKGVKDAIGSPTFSIINEYAYAENGRNASIFHIDLYRLKDEQEIEQAGVEDCIYSGNICMVEWPDKAPQLFDENTVHVYVSTIDDETRSVKIEMPAGSVTEQS